jgi:hypothetical protein
LEKKEIAALLESLCGRPFAGDPEGPAVAAAASRVAQALSEADAERAGSDDQSGSGEAGNPGADLAAILSGTATEPQCRAFHEAAVTSGAVRLEAQSALAFIEAIEQAPLAAPSHLVEQVVASTGGAPSRARPGIWSSLSGSLIGRWRGRAAAAFAVMLMATGLSWSLLRQAADVGPTLSVVPVATAPKEAISAISPGPDSTPAEAPPAAPAPLPAAPEPAPAPSLAPPTSAPAVQALADPCTPRSAAISEPQAASSDVKFRVVKPAPKQPLKTAGVDAPDPGCAVDPGARLVVNPAVESARDQLVWPGRR